MKVLEKIGAGLARHLSEPRRRTEQVATSVPKLLARSLQPGDVLLVDGNSTFSTAIKYLTQSSWSHAALFVGDALPPVENGEEQPMLVEVM